MYFWKCWHDSRDRFLTCLIGLSCLMTMMAYFVVANRSRQPATAEFFWKDLAMLRVPLGTVVLPVIAVLLATFGVGEEFGAGTSALLFTRPRKRSYFVWVSWATGMLEMSAIIVVPVMCAALTGFLQLHRITSWRFLSVFAYVLPICTVVYGMAHFASVLGWGARRGTAISLGVLLLYVVTVQGMWRLFGIELPDWWVHQLAAHCTGYTAAVAIGGWLAFSLLFPWAAQRILEAREI